MKHNYYGQLNKVKNDKYIHTYIQKTINLQLEDVKILIKLNLPFILKKKKILHVLYRKKIEIKLFNYSDKVMCNCFAVAIKTSRPFCLKSIILKLIQTT